jgi:hypothetical protein
LLEDSKSPCRSIRHGVIGLFDRQHGDDVRGIVKKSVAVHFHRFSPPIFTIASDGAGVTHREDAYLFPDCPMILWIFWNRDLPKDDAAYLPGDEDNVTCRDTGRQRERSTAGLTCLTAISPFAAP